MGQAHLQAGSGRREQRRQGRSCDLDGEGDCRRPNLARGHTGQDRHRSDEKVAGRACPARSDLRSSSPSPPSAPASRQWEASGTRGNQLKLPDRSSSFPSTRCERIICLRTATLGSGRRPLMPSPPAASSSSALIRTYPRPPRTHRTALGPSAVRDRRTRQRWIHHQGRRAPAAADAARARLHYRRRGFSLSAAQGDRNQPWLRLFPTARCRQRRQNSRSDRCSAMAASPKRSPSTGSIRSAPRARSCFFICTNRTSRTRRRNVSGNTCRTTAKSLTATNSSAVWSASSRSVSSTIARPFCCCQITGRAWGITANRSTDCSFTRRPCACRSSSSRRAAPLKVGASPNWFSTSISHLRCSIWSRHRRPATAPDGRCA